MARIMSAIFIIVFWLSFPVLAGYLDIGVNELDIKELEVTPNTGGVFGGTFKSISNMIGVYFATLTMTIPGIPLFMRFIVWILQAVSVLVVYVLLRG